MYRLIFAAVSLCVLADLGPVAARGLREAGEVEHARDKSARPPDLHPKWVFRTWSGCAVPPRQVG
jgi:hypothetical protein